MHYTVGQWCISQHTRIEVHLVCSETFEHIYFCSSFHNGKTCLELFVWNWDTVWVHFDHQSFSSFMEWEGQCELFSWWEASEMSGQKTVSEKKRRMNCFSLSVVCQFPWLSTPSISLCLSHSQCEFLSGSLTFCLSLLPSSSLLVNTHYSQQTQWQFSPPAIWDQYWVSSTTSWPDILISVIQTKYCAFCPPTRQPTVYSPSEWLKSNVERYHICNHS